MTDHDRLSGDPREVQLRRAAATLPRDIAPAEDAWPAIRARIDAARVVPIAGAATHPRCATGHPWRLAATAAVLVVASSAATLLVMRRPEATTVRAPSAVTPADPGIEVGERRRLVTDVFRSYDAAAGDLERLLNARRDRMSPGAVRVVEESLRAIDQAIGESRTALQRDPASHDLLDLLDSVYRQKLDLLRRANELPLRSS